MIIVAALVLVALTFAFIVYPLFKQRSHPVNLIEGDELREEAGGKGEAISIFRDVHDLEESPEIDEAIERQVRELRQAKHLVCPQCGARYQERDQFCSHCGTGLNKEEAS